MERIIINPENYEDIYIYNLNQCFNSWGGRQEYNWVFNRVVGENQSDIIVIKDKHDDVIAGSGITYRKLIIDDHHVTDIGIMTGSWTLPIAQGKGCFSKIIEVSKNICTLKRVPFLTAFVMESNPSFRRLKNAGSSLISTYHFVSKEIYYSDIKTITVLKKEPKIYSELYYNFIKAQKGYLKFYYTHEEFYQQYINRSKNTEILQIGDDYAVIEETENIIKVVFITFNTSSLINNTKALANWGLQTKSKKILIFTTKKEIAEALNILGFEYSSGYFTILNSSKDSSINMDIFNQVNINLGDKM